jgi:hypothetical protein
MLPSGAGRAHALDLLLGFAKRKGTIEKNKKLHAVAVGEIIRANHLLT